MVIGVTDGYRKQLEIVGVGYRAEAQGANALRLNLGFSHPVHVTAPDGITFEVPVPTQVVISGIDKEVVGQVAGGAALRTAALVPIGPAWPCRDVDARPAGRGIRSIVRGCPASPISRT